MIDVDSGNGLRIRTLAIADLKEQDINAHVMAPAMFERLVENIRTRGHLESLPYCARPRDDGPTEIVSGHHRIRAARKAGLTEVTTLVDTNPLTRSQIIAKQLAHNALVGQDDTDLVKQLVAMIDTVDDLLETGLGPNFLPTPDSFAVTLFTPVADYQWRTATFIFLSHQLAHFDDLIKALKPEAKTLCVACESQFEPFCRAVASFARERHIVSAASAVATLTELATEQAAELKAQREAVESQADVAAANAAMKSGPLLSTLFGSARMPADSAAVVSHALDQMIRLGDLERKSKWLAIERWAADYLAGAAAEVAAAAILPARTSAAPEPEATPS